MTLFAANRVTDCLEPRAGQLAGPSTSSSTQVLLLARDSQDLALDTITYLGCSLHSVLDSLLDRRVFMHSCSGTYSKRIRKWARRQVKVKVIDAITVDHVKMRPKAKAGLHNCFTAMGRLAEESIYQPLHVPSRP